MLNKLTDAQVGQTLQFTYFGGSTPGEQRLVKVEEVRDDRIVALDLEKNELRIFLVDKAAGIVEIQALPSKPRNTNCFTAVEARDAIQEYINTLEGDDLAQALCECQGGIEATCDECGLIVVQYEPDSRFDVTEAQFTIFNDDNVEMVIGRVAYDNEVVVVDNEEINDPYELAHRLCKHLGLTIA